MADAIPPRCTRGLEECAYEDSCKQYNDAPEDKLCNVSIVDDVGNDVIDVRIYCINGCLVGLVVYGY